MEALVLVAYGVTSKENFLGIRKIGMVFVLIYLIPLSIIQYPIFKLVHPRELSDWYPDGFIEYLSAIKRAIIIDWRG